MTDSIDGTRGSNDRAAAGPTAAGPATATGGGAARGAGAWETGDVEAGATGAEHRAGMVLTAKDADLDVERVVDEQQYDRLKTLGPTRRVLILVVSAAWIGWQMWIAGTIPLAPVPMRSLHLTFALVLTFLMLPSFSRRFRLLPSFGRHLHRHVILALDLVLAALGAATMLHLFRNFTAPDFLRVINPEPIDVILGWAALALVIVAVYRATGLPLAVTSIMAIAYAMLGQYIPGPAGHNGFAPDRVLSFLYLRVEGVLGSAVGASATFIFPVVIFGALLIAMGGGAFFADLATALLGKVRGATAKIAVIATGMFASISGAGATDVASTGPFTIPLMRRQGFPRHFAAATESSAAIGAQITPPIMGASAFVMAEFLNIPYSQIVRHALIPAALFYVMVFVSVHFSAARERVPDMVLETVSPLRVLARGWQFLLPLLYLFYNLAWHGQSVAKSALQAIVLLLVLDLGRRAVTRQPLQLIRLVRGAVNGVKSGLIVGTATAAVQILIASVGLTGIGIKLSSIMVGLAHGSLLLLLIITMIASLLLGTGMPTVPTYLILAILTAPALTEHGVPLIAAHFFVLYFGVMSDLTPPTALGPTIAAGIAGAPLMRTMLKAMQLGLAGFVLPYMFIYRPALLLEGTMVEILVAVGAALLAVLFLAIGLSGYLRAPLRGIERLLLVAAGAALIPPILVANIAGAVAGLAVIAMLRLRKSGQQPALPALAG